MQQQQQQQQQQQEEEDGMLVGVIEGFYGRPWTASQRVELLELLSSPQQQQPPQSSSSPWRREWCFVYAPKDDSKHRTEWRTLYDQEEANALSTLISKCLSCGVRFVYALSPGLDLSYSPLTPDLDAIKAKFSQLASLGCSDFAIFFDDIDPSLPLRELAFGQARISNDVLHWLHHHCCVTNTTARKPKLLFCPTEYCEMMTKPSLEESIYVKTLADELDPRVLVMWTGDDIISRTITEHHVRRVTAAFKRKPFIWDSKNRYTSTSLS